MVFALIMTGIEASDKAQPTDDQLMLAFKRGDKAAFDQLYHRYRQPIYNYLYRNCGRPSTTDELFQDVWLKMIAATKRYESKNKFRQWVFTLAHNCLIDFYRRAAKLNLEDELPEEVETFQQSVDREVADNETSIAVKRAILALPEDQRQAFCLREESGFSIKDIAEIQKITAEAAKSRLRYAYQKLRQELGEVNR